MSRKPVKTSNGFTLIEVLITVLILSIGLLGLAGLQVSSMKSNHSSYLRSQATILAYDIIDRMRANPDAVIDNSGNVLGGGGAYIAKNNTPGTTDGCTDKDTGCSTIQMAQTDINQWRADLAAQLPGGLGAVCLDTTPDSGTAPDDAECSDSGNVYAIKIWWTDDRSGNAKRFVVSYAP